MKEWIAVFAGGGLGSIARYAISKYANTEKLGIPWGTLSANFLACFILGMLISYEMQHPLDNGRTNLPLWIGSGFCGGFSTFSTFSAESLYLLQNQKIELGISYIIGTLVTGVIGLLSGMFLLNLASR